MLSPDNRAAGESCGCTLTCEMVLVPQTSRVQKAGLQSCLLLYKSHKLRGMAPYSQSGHHWVLGNSWQDTRGKQGFRTLGKKCFLREHGRKGGQQATGLPIKPDSCSVHEKCPSLIPGLEMGS